MSFDFGFRTVDNRRDLLRLLDFIRLQDLSYPNYQDWVSRTESEIDMGWKKAVIATSDSIVLGDIIWQPHKELPRVRELKNMRVNPLVRERYFARFLTKQAEVEDKDSYDTLMLDLREDHPEKKPLMHMLVSMGYRELAAVCLYDPNVKDIVMMKKKAA